MLFPLFAKAQLSIEWEFDDIPSSGQINLSNEGGCGTIMMGGQSSSGKSNARWEVDLINGVRSIRKLVVDGKEPDWKEWLLPDEIGCVYDIFNVRGSINAYVVNADKDITLSKTINGSVSYTDQVRIYSPDNQTIAVPVRVSAALAAVQTFADPNESEAIARVSLTASFGNSEIELEGERRISGALIDNDIIKENKIIQFEAKKGVNILPVMITGTLFVESKVRAVARGVAAASNPAVAADNSLVVGNFTGVDGQTLLDGTEIVGLSTGLNYLNPSASNDCSDPPLLDIKTTDATCGKSNGKAMASIGDSDDYKLRWSNGQMGEEAINLSPGTYYIISERLDGCYFADSVVILDSPPPNLDLKKQYVIDAGDSLNLGFDEKKFSYEWSTGESTPKITVTEPGKYSVSITDTLGCIFTFGTTIRIKEDGFNIAEGNIITDDGIFFDDGGSLFDYQDDTSYVVTICPTSDEVFIYLDFTEVDIANSEQDDLAIFDGIDTNCPLAIGLEEPGRYSATSSSNGCLTVRFRSTSADGNRKGAGWRAEIGTSLDPPIGCVQAINTCDSSFTDAGGPNANYFRDAFEIYEICPDDPSYKATLRFDSVDIGQDANLAIYDGTNTECLLEPRLTEPATFTASNRSNGCLTVIFNSTSQNTAPGWEAEIGCVSVGPNPPDHCQCKINPPPD